MLHFIFRKLLSNKGLNLCLITGTIFWIAVFTLLPVFNNGSINQILSSDFAKYAEETGEYPAVIGWTNTLVYSGDVKADKIIDNIDERENGWLESLELDDVARQRIIRTTEELGRTYYGGRNKRLNIAYIPELSEITDIVNESAPAFDTGNEAYPVYISEATMDTLGLVSGEEIYFDKLKDENEKELHIRIVGIIREKEDAALSWHHPIEEYRNSAFTDKDSFDEIVNRFGMTEITLEDYVSIDYRDIRFDNADKVVSTLDEISSKDKHVEYNFKEITENYKREKSSIKSIMLSAALPLFALLTTFILMVSGSIAENERGEMSVLRSRGIKRREIIMLYFLRSTILTIVALGPGILLGSFFVWVGRQTNGFLIFKTKDTADYYLSPESITIALLGALLAIILITLPVISQSKKTIIDNKNESMASAKKPLWKKLFLDVILTGVSIYLLHNYNQQRSSLSEKMVNGESIDPLIMLGSSVFVIGVALLLLRIIDLLVRFIFFLGKKRWNPAAFAGFLQIIRSGSRQGIISVFLVLTLATGIFDASLARTVNENNVERIKYDIGTDVRMTGNWVRMMRFNLDSEPVYYYKEPDYADFRQLYEDGLLSSMTRVIYDRNSQVGTKSSKVDNVILMGINTTEFGRTAELKSGLNDSHWYNALNSIAESADGVIVSSNLAQKLNIKVGDKINVTKFDVDVNRTETGTVKGTVNYIVDAWPGYESSSYVKDENGKYILQENYLAVMNYATADSSYSLTTYDIWGKLPEGSDYESFKEELDRRNIQLAECMILPESIEEMHDSAMIQITNGLFSIHFIISIIICILGFLIYWITSVKKRALQFGIYRAMGLRMREIVRMLVMEHFFSSFLAIAAGAGAGILTANLYDRLISIIYLPKQHNIPIEINMSLPDILKPVLIITAALLVAIFIISRIIKKMRISETLKMGEDS